VFCRHLGWFFGGLVEEEVEWAGQGVLALGGGAVPRNEGCGVAAKAPPKSVKTLAPTGAGSGVSSA
jgi:hypothetical protein